MIEWIKNLRSTERGKTLFKFILYLVFLFFVMILCMVAGAMNEPVTGNFNNSTSKDEESVNSESKTLTYFDKQELLATGKYEFEYKIILTGEEISFLGDYNNGEVDAYKETKDNLWHFKIENGSIYKINLFEKEEMPTLNEEIEIPIFELSKLFAVLNGLTASIIRDGEYKNYTYDLEEINYKIVTDDDSIKEIIILKGDDKYELSFKF